MGQGDLARDEYDWRICRLHGRAQDDPDHDYKYPDCENAGYDEAAGAPLREALERAYEPGNSEQWRSGYLYAERIALTARAAAAERWDKDAGPPFDGDRAAAANEEKE